MSWFVWASLGSWLVVVVAARLIRNSTFAAFAAVIVGIYTLIAVGVFPIIAGQGRLLPIAYASLHASVYANFLALTRPRMRPLPYRLLVSWPSSFFVAGTMLALPWALVRLAGFEPGGIWLPYALAAAGLFQSLTTRRHLVRVRAGGPAARDAGPLRPYRRSVSPPESTRPLRVVQITDPHLGPFMSVSRLKAIATRAVEATPDLIVLTGDFLTMESQSDPELLLAAFAPLRALPGRVFACHGNHDHEAPEVVAHALRENGITLLVDRAELVETPAGPVQVLGMDYVRRGRKAHLAKVCAAFPRAPGALRIVLLHDPGAFSDLPEGEGDLVMSGHTHGGQLGLLSVGLPWTFLSFFGVRFPDHGLWARGRDRMYVHRGTGHYGFPLRLGVPAEESVLSIDAP